MTCQIKVAESHLACIYRLFAHRINGKNFWCYNIQHLLSYNTNSIIIDSHCFSVSFSSLCLYDRNIVHALFLQCGCRFIEAMESYIALDRASSSLAEPPPSPSPNEGRVSLAIMYTSSIVQEKCPQSGQVGTLYMYSCYTCRYRLGQIGVPQ